MKVLVVGTGGALGGSGITAMADQMVRTLAEMGHEPIRLVAGDRRRRRPNRLNLENVLATVTEAVTVARAARSTRADVVWLHTFGVPVLPAARALAMVAASRVAGCRIIVQFHAFDLQGHLEAGGFAQRLILRLVGRLSAGLVTLDGSDAEALQRCAPGAEVTVLPNWADVAPEPVAVPPGALHIAVFVGGVTNRKGVPELLAAMRMLEDIPLQLRVVGGPGDEGIDEMRAIERSAEDLTTSGRVVFLGELSPAAVRRELRGAQLFILPSKAEGTPRSLLEAMGVGRAVIVTDVGNMGAIVRAAECGVVLPSSQPDVLSQSIRDALDHEQLLAWSAGAHRAAASLEASSRENLTTVLQQLAG